jgi:hypothetical protein
MTLKAHIEDIHSSIKCWECELRFLKDDMRMNKYWAHGQKLINVTKSSRASDQDETRNLEHVPDTEEVNDTEAKSDD